MIQYHLLASAAPSFALGVYFYLKHRRVKFIDNLPLPPGPKTLPLIGNLLDKPASFEWMTYHKWCKELGPPILKTTPEVTLTFAQRF